MKHEITELLPFYANGTLDPDDRARVEAELATCASCAEELHDLEALGASLRARAEAAPPLPGRALDDALARINTPPFVSASTRLRTAWWGTPARYATAAALVVAVGAAGVAAWHAHEAATTVVASVDGTSVRRDPGAVFRVGAARQPKIKINTVMSSPGASTKTEAAQAAPPASVAKQHRLAKKAHLDLLVRDVEATLKQAQTTVRSAGGDVTSLSDENPRDAGAVHSASLQVEVPAARLEDTLDRLALLGTVQNRAIDADDVDAAIIDEEARLRNLRREEIDLRALMDKGGKVNDILNVQQNLSDVRGQIEQLDAQHRNDVHRVATSTIAIALTEDRPNPTSAKPGPSARIDGAWHGGLNALADTMIALLSAIVWCVAYSPVPLAFAGITYAATRLLMRRRATAP